MKNHFSLRRFGLLFRKHTVENYKTYLLSLGVLLGALALVMATIVYLSGSPLSTNFQGMFFALFLLGAGAIFTSTVFSYLGDKKTAIASLTLPASSLEKFLVGWLYSLPVFLSLFIPTFYLVVSLILNVDSRTSANPEYLNIFNEEQKVYGVFILYILLNAVMLVGSVFFNKGHFIKTAFIGFIGLILFYNLNKQILQALLGLELSSAMPFSEVIFKENEQHYGIGAYEEQTFLFILIPIVMAMAVWIAAYFKVKEKQV